MSEETKERLTEEEEKALRALEYIAPWALGPHELAERNDAITALRAKLERGASASPSPSSPPDFNYEDLMAAKVAIHREQMGAPSSPPERSMETKDGVPTAHGDWCNAGIHAAVSWTYVKGERADESLLRVRRALKEPRGWWQEQDEAEYQAATSPPSPAPSAVERVQVYVPWPEEQGSPEGWPETYVGENEFRAVERERDELHAEVERLTAELAEVGERIATERAEARDMGIRRADELKGLVRDVRQERDALRARVTELEDQMANMVPATFAGMLQLLDTWYPADVFTASAEDVGARLVVVTRRVTELENAARETLKACGHVEQWGQSGERAALMVLRRVLLSDNNEEQA